MKKILIYVIILIMALYGKVMGKSVEIPGLDNPAFIIVDTDRFYVVDGIKVKIFSLKDYKKIGEFGKEGSGPGEFQKNPFMSRFTMQLTTSEDKLLISNMGRVFNYTRDGKYLSEKKSPGMRSGNFRFFGDNYVAVSFQMVDNVPHRTILLYDKEFKELKQIAKVKVTGSGGKVDPVPGAFEHAVIGDYVYISSVDGMEVKRFDKTGKPAGKVNVADYKFRPLNDTDKGNILKTFEKMSKQLYNMMKSRLAFPEKFPAIQRMFADGDHIVVQTWKDRKDGKRELYIFDKDLKNYKVVYVPFSMEDAIMPSPSDFHKGVMYQLVENEDSEEWDLHITKVI